LPTDDEWRQLAKHYGGLANDSPDKRRAAYRALLSGGTSDLNAVLGGNRSADWHRGGSQGVTATQGTSDTSGTTVSVADPI
jgi:hypothetical protein